MQDQKVSLLQFKHWDDDRSQSQIFLTNRLARAVSERNLAALDLYKPQSLNFSVAKQDFLYVCIQGSTPYQNEFRDLNLPGQTLTFCSTALQQLKTDEYKFLKATWQQQVQQLNRKIRQCSTSKPLVFVYHSFGTFILLAYLHFYPKIVNRILGLIDIGGLSITAYPSFKSYMQISENMTMQQIQDNLDEFMRLFNEASKSLGQRVFDNKYQYMATTRVWINNKGMSKMFQLMRNLPSVLQCFIYGRKDKIITQGLLNEKAIYYAQKNQLQSEVKLKEAYQKCFDIKCDNIQERFIFNIQEGIHSIHMQTRFKQKIAKIVNSYLNVLEIGLNNKNSSL